MKAIRLVLMTTMLMIWHAGLAAQAETRRFSDWFAVESSVLLDWDVQTDIANPGVLRVMPRTSPEASPYRIHVIYPKASPAYDKAFSRMLAVFSAKGIAAIFEVSNYAQDQSRAGEVLASANRQRAELIVAMGSDTTDWLWNTYRGGHIPVVSMCAKDPVLMGQAASYETGSQSNFAFTSLNMPIATQITHIRGFIPGLKNVAILVDGANSSAVRTQAEPLARALDAEGVRTHLVSVHKGDQLEQDLREKIAAAIEAMRDTDPDLANSALWITGSTLLFSRMKIIDQSAGRLPILSAVTDIVGDMPGSALMAVGISFESNAHLAALTIIDILQGATRPDRLPVGLVKNPDIAINFAKARERGHKIPFPVFESATRIYGYEGQLLRADVKPAAD